MKTMKKTSILTIAILMIAATSIFAQRGRYYSDSETRYGRSMMCNLIPDLTEDQETKIEALRVDHLKEMNNYRNQMNELRAKKQTLMTSDNLNMNEINSVIDQMTGVHGKMMKASAKHRQDVRNLLTEDQKVYFDSRLRRGNGRGHGRGMGRAGRGNRNFDGYGQGYGRGQGLGYGNGDGYGQRYNN